MPKRWACGCCGWCGWCYVVMMYFMPTRLELANIDSQPVMGGPCCKIVSWSFGFRVAGPGTEPVFGPAASERKWEEDTGEYMYEAQIDEIVVRAHAATTSEMVVSVDIGARRSPQVTHSHDLS